MIVQVEVIDDMRGALVHVDRARVDEQVGLTGPDRPEDAACAGLHNPDDRSAATKVGEITRPLRTRPEPAAGPGAQQTLLDE